MNIITRIINRFSLRLLILIPAITVSGNVWGFCSSLETAIEDADTGFESLRGTYDFQFLEYKANISLGELDECSISTGQGVSSLTCDKVFRGAGHDGDMDSLFERTTTALTECLGSRAKVKKSRPNHWTFELLDSDDDIDVVKRRSVSSKGIVRYRVYLDLTYVDPTWKP